MQRLPGAALIPLGKHSILHCGASAYGGSEAHRQAAAGELRETWPARRDRYHSLSALGDRFPLEIDDAEFRTTYMTSVRGVVTTRISMCVVLLIDTAIKEAPQPSRRRNARFHQGSLPG